MRDWLDDQFDTFIRGWLPIGGIALLSYLFGCFVNNTWHLGMTNKICIMFFGLVVVLFLPVCIGVGILAGNIISALSNYLGNLGKKS